MNTEELARALELSVIRRRSLLTWRLLFPDAEPLELDDEEWEWALEVMNAER